MEGASSAWGDVEIEAFERVQIGHFSSRACGVVRRSGVCVDGALEACPRSKLIDTDC